MATARCMTGEAVGEFLEELSIIEVGVGVEVICHPAKPDCITLEISFRNSAFEELFRSSLADGRLSRFKGFFPTH